MTTYTYAELEGLWINAGGPRALAPIAAAIAEAESGGNSDAYNGHDSNGRGGTQVSAGLWQISNGTMTPVQGWSDPATNAKYAVGKYKGANNSFSPWGTYTSGAYKAYLSGKTSPVLTVAGSPTAAGAASAASAGADCLVANPLSVSLPIVGTITGGPACLFTYSNARAFIGAGFLIAGALIAFSGLATIAVGTGLKAASAAANAAGKVPVAGKWVKAYPAGQRQERARQAEPRKERLLTPARAEQAQRPPRSSQARAA